MKAKLIKEAGGYDLYRIDADGKRVTFASTQDYKQKLSLKNCQAIELGYDLDELISAELEKLPYTKHLDDGQYNDGQLVGFELGAYWAFQKALEILGDKKFSEKELAEALTNSWSFHGGITDYVKSLQQTEWDVIVEMDRIPADRAPEGWEVFPKLDAEGCLILKRI